MKQEAREWLVHRAIEAAPFEVCGFVLDTDEIIEIRNVSLAPTRAFRMDRDELVQKLSGRVEFISGIWHSHPRGTTYPSHTDLDGIKLGAIQRNWDYFIVTSAGVFQYDTGLYAPEDHLYWEKFLHDSAAS